MKIKKTILMLLSAALLIGCQPTVAGATGECHWYIKRNGNSCPFFPGEAEIIKEYNAYYIDQEASDNNEKVLYLTFDAGYENGNIEKILNTLSEENVPAGFFLLDNIILKNTDLVKRMASEGHTVCNHTKNHKNLSGADAQRISEDLGALEELYKEKTGLEMAKYFRFPEGKYSLDALRFVNDLGYKTVFWSFAYDDWDNSRQMQPEKAMNKILNNTHPGAIILLHPTSSTNAQILSGLIKEWRKMGYRFGTLDELTSK